LTMAL